MTKEEVKEFLKKDEYGLYVNAENYSKCRASAIISEIVNENLKKVKLRIFEYG